MTIINYYYPFFHFTASDAATTAGVAAGVFANLQEAADAAVRIKSYIEPNAAHHQVYDDTCALYH